MQEALDCEKWREYGDLLYAYGQNIPKGTPSVTLTTFDQSKQVKIDLDVRFDGRGNAKKCFQKYNKGKKGQDVYKRQVVQNAVNTFEQTLAAWMTAGRVL